jgi:protein-disulfide isomerase
VDPTCLFDETKEPVEDFVALINPEDPVFGNEAASVTLIEYFDPNCPHCKHLHPVMNATLAAYGDQIRVVYKPVALPGWTWSVPQVSALWTAAEDGKFKEMLDRQFAMQKQRGLSVEELKSIASEIGMDVGKMEQQIEDGAFNDRMMATMEQVRAIGMTGVPAVLLNGQFIAPSSRNEACFAQLVEAALPQDG